MRLYLVRCLHDACLLDWRRDKWTVSAAERILRAFTDPLAATDFLNSLQRGDILPPRTLNPFAPLAMNHFEGRHNTTFSDLSSVTEQHFLARMTSMGLPLPMERSNDKRRAQWDWPSWWNRLAIEMTEHQQREIRKLLNRIPLFEIIETEMELD